MPIYEYRCTACGEQFEVLQKVADRPLRRCRSCKGKLERLISRTSFLLKGGGWYSEGYAKKPAKPDAGGKSDGGESSGGGATKGSPGESSPAGSKS